MAEPIASARSQRAVDATHSQLAGGGRRWRAAPSAGAKRRRFHPARARDLPRPSRPAGRAGRSPVPCRRQPGACAPDARAPVTLGLGEPFSTSITVAFAFALLLGLPFLLAQAWAFAAPALAPADRRAVRPLLALAPALFATGAAFAYFLVLPPAVRFLQRFNHGAFDVLVQARAYYRFELMTMLCLGTIFEIPVFLLALGRAGILSSTALCRHRRYAIVAALALAALLPGTDPVTTLLETLPLIPLYEGTIVLLRFNERRRGRQRPQSG